MDLPEPDLTQDEKLHLAQMSVLMAELDLAERRIESLLVLAIEASRESGEVELTETGAAALIRIRSKVRHWAAMLDGIDRNSNPR